MMTRALIESLLALVAPHCSLCIRPATLYQNAVDDPQHNASVYRCDLHPGEGKWRELPGASVIREATSIVNSEREPLLMSLP